jgi:hypothetical protein
MEKNNKKDQKKETQEPSPDQSQSEERHLLEEPILVGDFLFMMTSSLEAKAWAYLGKIAHPETQKHKEDQVQARLAIDAIDALYKIMENTLSPEEKKDLQIRLTNLRLNFAK